MLQKKTSQKISSYLNVVFVMDFAKARLEPRVDNVGVGDARAFHPAFTPLLWPTATDVELLLVSLLLWPTATAVELLLDSLLLWPTATAVELLPVSLLVLLL
jgi:hypothetical protein